MTHKEKNIIREIMTRYSKVHLEIEKLEEQISEIKTQKDNLIKELKLIRKNESLVLESLKEKYGEDATLDLKTLELI
jgi:septation ring formation regulator EzrA